MNLLLNFFTKQATLMRRSTVLSYPPQLVFPALPEENNEAVDFYEHPDDWVAEKNHLKSML
jgi:hypothetical protein